MALARLCVFNFLTLDGYFTGDGDDIGWHNFGSDEMEFSRANVARGNRLIFGRKTYELMASFWPTEMGMKQDSVVAEGMDSAKKYVFSRSLKGAHWNNTELLTGDLISEIKKLKADGPDLTILGSGSLIPPLTDHKLIDEYQLMLNPLAIGEGTSLFHGLRQQANFNLINSTIMKSGNILLTYQPK